jgi:hypothetical protein
MSIPHRKLATPIAAEESWTAGYEQRKRELIARIISGKHYTNAFEYGCGDGSLSVFLAQHCSRLLCSDASTQSVQLTRRQLAGLRHTHIERLRLPMQWPEGRFDLIVLNDVGGDFDSNDVRRLVMRARMALALHGTLIACHQRTPFAGLALDGDTVHEYLHAGLALTRVLQHREPDLALDVWRAGANSMAM